MKIIIKKILRAVGSRMTYLIVGLSFSVVVIAVNAAMPALNTTTTVSSANTLTSGMWNGMVTDLGNIKTAVDGISPGFSTCITKTNGGTAWSAAPGTWVNGAGDGRLYAQADCDSGWTMTGGGCQTNETCWTDVVVVHSYPTGNSWVCGQNFPGCGWYVPTAYVRCCR